MTSKSSDPQAEAPCHHTEIPLLFLIGESSALWNKGHFPVAVKDFPLAPKED